MNVQDGGELQRKLAQLELDVDREQGWIRGGTKTEVPPPSPPTPTRHTFILLYLVDRVLGTIFLMSASVLPRHQKEEGIRSFQGSSPLNLTPTTSIMPASMKKL
jgi:hypothetical protein